MVYGEEVFYATTKDYGQYLTNESSDCFVVGILLLSLIHICPQDASEFMKGNFGFASTLLDTLKKYGNTCPVMISSSTPVSYTHLDVYKRQLL